MAVAEPQAADARRACEERLGNVARPVPLEEGEPLVPQLKDAVDAVAARLRLQ